LVICTQIHHGVCLVGISMCAREVALHVEKERYQYGTRKCLFKYILICFDANLVYSCKKKSEGNETRLWHKTSLRFFFKLLLAGTSKNDTARVF